MEPTTVAIDAVDWESMLRTMYPKPDPWTLWSLAWAAIGWYAAYRPDITGTLWID